MNNRRISALLAGLRQIQGLLHRVAFRSVRAFRRILPSSFALYIPALAGLAATAFVGFVGARMSVSIHGPVVLSGETIDTASLVTFLLEAVLPAVLVASVLAAGLAASTASLVEQSGAGPRLSLRIAMQRGVRRALPVFGAAVLAAIGLLGLTVLAPIISLVSLIALLVTPAVRLIQRRRDIRWPQMRTLLIGAVPLGAMLFWLVRWSLLLPAAALERHNPRQALRRSSQILQDRWLQMGAALFALALLVVGPQLVVEQIFGESGSQARLLLVLAFQALPVAALVVLFREFVPDPDPEFAVVDRPLAPRHPRPFVATTALFVVWTLLASASGLVLNSGTASAEEVNPADVSGFMFEDVEDLGWVFEIGPPVVGASVTLLDGGLAPTGLSTFTADDGSYRFDGLPAGNYFVEFVAPTGRLFAAKDVGGDDFLDSDVNPETGITDLFYLVEGGSAFRVDALLAPEPVTVTPAQLSGFYFEDDDGDGIVHEGPVPVVGMSVTLTNDVQTFTTLTEADGSYLFTNLVPDNYLLAFEVPAGREFSPADQGDDAFDSDVDPLTGSATVSLVEGESRTHVDALLAPIVVLPAALTGRAFDDVNNDGIRTDDEPALVGIEVELIDASTTLAPQVVSTDEMGGYSFQDLLPGTYTLSFQLPDGWGLTMQHQGNDGTRDSDIDPLAPQLAVSLGSGETRTSVDAGLVRWASIEGMVWEETGEDWFQPVAGLGIYEPDKQVLPEFGIAGASVNVWTLDGALTSHMTTTGSDGSYQLFVPRGAYLLGFVHPESHKRLTASNVGTDDAVDSDVDRTTGRVAVDVNSHEVLTDIDAGFMPLGVRANIDIPVGPIVVGFGETFEVPVTVSSTVDGWIPTMVITSSSSAFFPGTTAFELDALGQTTIRPQSSAPVGQHRLSASYPGDFDHNGANTAEVLIEVLPVPMTVELTSDPAGTSTYGQPLQLQANITTAEVDLLVASGLTANFYDLTDPENRVLLGETPVTSLAPSVTLSQALPLGDNSLLVEFVVAGQTVASADVLHTVTRASTALALTSTTESFQQGTTVTATVTAENDASFDRTGSLVFEWDGHRVEQRLRYDGTATIDIGRDAHGADLPVGDHAITATFTPDNQNWIGSSAARTHGVTPAEIELVFTVGQRLAIGDPQTFDVSIRSVIDGPVKPSGQVQVEGDWPVNAVPLDPTTGEATIVIDGLVGRGQDQLAVAKYFDVGGQFEDAVATRQVFVPQADVSIELAPLPAIVDSRDSVTLTATVSPEILGLLTSPTSREATVTFFDHGRSIATVPLSPSTGMATLQLGAPGDGFVEDLASGLHEITASYDGNPWFRTATSVAATFTVGKAAPTVVLTSATPTTYVAEALTIMAGLSGGPAGEPLGQISIYDQLSDSKIAGPFRVVPLDGGQWGIAEDIMLTHTERCAGGCRWGPDTYQLEARFEADPGTHWDDAASPGIPVAVQVHPVEVSVFPLRPSSFIESENPLSVAVRVENLAQVAAIVGPRTPVGTIELRLDGQRVGTVPVESAPLTGSQGSVVTEIEVPLARMQRLTVDEHTFTAAFIPLDPELFATSEPSAPASHTVTRWPTVTEFSAPSETLIFGAAAEVRWTTTVLAEYGHDGTPPAPTVHYGVVTDSEGNELCGSYVYSQPPAGPSLDRTTTGGSCSFVPETAGALEIRVDYPGDRLTQDSFVQMASWVGPRPAAIHVEPLNRLFIGPGNEQWVAVSVTDEISGTPVVGGQIAITAEGLNYPLCTFLVEDPTPEREGERGCVIWLSDDMLGDTLQMTASYSGDDYHQPVHVAMDDLLVEACVAPPQMYAHPDGVGTVSMISVIEPDLCQWRLGAPGFAAGEMLRFSSAAEPGWLSPSWSLLLEPTETDLEQQDRFFDVAAGPAMVVRVDFVPDCVTLQVSTSSIGNVVGNFRSDPRSPTCPSRQELRDCQQCNEYESWDTRKGVSTGSFLRGSIVGTTTSGASFWGWRDGISADLTAPKADEANDVWRQPNGDVEEPPTSILSADLTQIDLVFGPACWDVPVHVVGNGSAVVQLDGIECHGPQGHGSLERDVTVSIMATGPSYFVGWSPPGGAPVSVDVSPSTDVGDVSEDSPGPISQGGSFGARARDFPLDVHFETCVRLTPPPPSEMGDIVVRTAPNCPTEFGLYRRYTTVHLEANARSNERGEVQHAVSWRDSDIASCTGRDDRGWMDWGCQNHAGTRVSDLSYAEIADSYGRLVMVQDHVMQPAFYDRDDCRFNTRIKGLVPATGWIGQPQLTAGRDYAELCPSPALDAPDLVRGTGSNPTSEGKLNFAIDLNGATTLDNQPLDPLIGWAYTLEGEWWIRDPESADRSADKLRISDVGHFALASTELEVNLAQDRWVSDERNRGSFTLQPALCVGVNPFVRLVSPDGKRADIGTAPTGHDFIIAEPAANCPFAANAWLVGTEVTFTAAAPPEMWDFLGWKGSANPSDVYQTIVLDGSEPVVDIRAVYQAVECYLLSNMNPLTNADGDDFYDDGGAIVQPLLAPNCPGRPPGAQLYVKDTVVELVVLPIDGHNLSGTPAPFLLSWEWRGWLGAVDDPDTMDLSNTVTMDAAKNVGADHHEVDFGENMSLALANAAKKTIGAMGVLAPLGIALLSIAFPPAGVAFAVAGAVVGGVAIAEAAGADTGVFGAVMKTLAGDGYLSCVSDWGFGSNSAQFQPGNAYAGSLSVAKGAKTLNDLRNGWGPASGLLEEFHVSLRTGQRVGPANRMQALTMVWDANASASAARNAQRLASAGKITRLSGNLVKAKNTFGKVAPGLGLALTGGLAVADLGDAISNSEVDYRLDTAFDTASLDDCATRMAGG